MRLGLLYISVAQSSFESQISFVTLRVQRSVCISLYDIKKKLSDPPSLLCQIYADPPFLGRQKVNDPPLNSSGPPPLLKNECSLITERLSHFLLLNDFPPPSRSLEQAINIRTGISWEMESAHVSPRFPVKTSSQSLLTNKSETGNGQTNSVMTAMRCDSDATTTAGVCSRVLTWDLCRHSLYLFNG